MNGKSEVVEDKLDGLKWAAALLLVGAGLFGFYYYPEQSLLLRVVVVLGVVGAGLMILKQTSKGRQAWEFVGDARTEVRKVVWPTRKETVQTTLIVIAMVTLMSLVLWLLDMFLGWAIRAIIGSGG